MKECNYSVIIPIYNESDSVLPLYNALRDVMDNLHESYEIIFINDGSIQTDIECLKNKMDKNIARIINLPKHVGQTGALASGFREAGGRLIISMDGDLQDNPKYIPQFVSKLYEGYDAVCGYRINRKDKKSKVILSRIGNFLQKIILRTDLHDICCTYRIYKKECTENLRLIRKGYNKYIPIFLIRDGYRVTEIPIEQERRIFGKSKYSFFCKIVELPADFLYLLFDISMKKV